MFFKKTKKKSIGIRQLTSYNKISNYIYINKRVMPFPFIFKQGKAGDENMGIIKKKTVTAVLAVLLVIALLPFLQLHTVKAATYTLTWSDVERKVHYGYLEGTQWHEFEDGEEGTVDLRLPEQIGDQLDLEKEIEGYRYVTTRINNAVNGRQISPLLITDPPYNNGNQNNYTNQNLTAYPSYNIGTSPRTFNVRWRYRQLSSLSWNPIGGSGWNATNRWDSRVTDYGITKPVTFANSETDIYVVYEKQIETPDDEETDLGELGAPTTDKNVEINGDGTYDVVLSVIGESRGKTQKTKANVVVVLDTSWSMYYDLTGQDTYTGSTSRLNVAKSAINSLADKLFALNSEEEDTVELAFVSFAQRVRNEEEMQTIYKGTDAATFKSMINDLDCASGTNWDDALYAADHVVFGDNDPTYIVFITDGNTISSAHPYGTYSDWDGGTYYNGGNISHYVEGAKHQADKIVNNPRKVLYTIGAFGDVSNLQSLGGTYLGQANNQEKINGYFDDIIAEIKNNLGYSDVVINDGITEMTSTSLVSGKAGEFKYYRSGGKNEDDTEKYDSDANDGRGETWDDAPEAMYLEIIRKEGSNSYVFKKNGSEDTGFTEEEKTAFINKYLTEEERTGTEAVHIKTVVWDINLGENVLLEDGVTYTIAFTVWPSQAAYDLIADLNNRVKDYDSLSQKEKDQIFESGGIYYLKTNTKATVDYTSIQLENGVPIEETRKTDSATIKDPEGKMNLESDMMVVKKEFAHSINAMDPYTRIAFYVLIDGKYYQKDGTLSETLDEEKVYAIILPQNKEVDGETVSVWEDDVFIAPGLMRGGEILETGHQYSLEEKVLSGNVFEYEFTPQIVRPMIIHAVPTYLVLKDKYNTNEDDKAEYVFDDSDQTYREATEDDEEDIYYVASENNGVLVGTNRKTAELDITKVVEIDPDYADALSEEELAALEARLDDETFTYLITLTVPKEANTTGMTAYEYVPRYDDAPEAGKRYTIFGYQETEEESVRGFDDDVERFSGKIYGGYTVTYSNHPQDDNTLNCIFTEDEGKDTKTGAFYITLKQKEIIRLTNLPSGTEYTIQEIYANKKQADPARNADAKPGTNDPASNIAEQSYAIEIETKNGTATISKTATDNDTISGSVEDLDVRYYNRFTNTLGNSVDVNLNVTKHLEGYEWIGERYYMNLTAGTATYADGTKGTSPMPASNRAYITKESGSEDGQYSFGKVRFTKAGVYSYTIAEDNAGAQDQTVNKNGDVSVYTEHIDFDTAKEFTITVVEEDGSGVLRVENIEGDATQYTEATEEAIASSNTTITNKRQPEKVEVTITKVWADNGDQDGLRVAEEDFAAKLTLYANRTAVTDVTPTVIVDKNDPDKYIVTWTGLPKQAAGSDITYTVTEAEIEGYTTSYGAEDATYVENGGTITNKHIPEVTEASVIKVWDDGDNQDGIRLTELTVQLLADGNAVEGKTATLSASNQWSATEPNLPKKNNGTEIVYSWTEDTTKLPEGYSLNEEKSGTAKREDGTFVTTLTNTYSPKTVDISVVKDWADNNDQDGTRPKKLVLELLADGEVVKKDDGISVTVTLAPNEDPDKNWKATLTGLPMNKAGKAISYSWSENERDLPQGYSLTSNATDYQTNVTTITNTLNAKTVDVSVEKKWEDNNNQDGIRPTSLVVQLMADGKEVEGKTLTLMASQNPDHNWKGTITGLPKNKDGVEIKYTWTEILPQDSGYTLISNVTTGLSTIITNKHVPDTIDPLSLKKEWDDANDQDGKRPGSLKVTLLKNGSEYATFTLNEGNNWTVTTDPLPKNEAGTEIKYSWKEDNLPKGYSLTKQEVKGSLTTFTNSYSPETTSIRVLKKWDDFENKYATRPESVTVQLIADGTAVGDKVILNADNQWTYTWKDSDSLPIPKYKAVGKEISYEVKETDVSGYVLSNIQKETTDEGTMITIVNKWKVVVVDPPVQKILTGKDAEKLYNKGDFTFKIENVSAPEGVEAPMPKDKDGNTVTNITNSSKYEFEDRNGFYEFGEIIFTIPGVYEYKVTESGNVKGVTNDPEAATGKTLVFTVSEDDKGNLTISPAADQVQFTFTNQYVEKVPTGDHSNMILWMILMVLAAGVGTASLILLKKDWKEN